MKLRDKIKELLVERGRTAREIAEELGQAEAVVRNELSMMYFGEREKLRVTSSQGVVLYYMKEE